MNGTTVTGAAAATYAYIPADGDIVTCILTSNATCAVNNPATSNAVIMSVSSVPTVNVLQNITVTGTQCFDAIETITVAGGGTFFTVQSGGHATMIAGQLIHYLPGTLVNPGGYLHGYITTTGQYCMSLSHSIVATEAGVNELPFTDSNPGMKIYPNPTTGKFTLELTGIGRTEKVRVDVYGMEGNNVLSAEMTGMKGDFSLSDKPSGVYLVHVITHDGSVTSRMIKR